MNKIELRTFKIIMLSGGFDPVHVGHVRMIQHAKMYGTVVVALNSDEWLMRKKHYVFMRWDDRSEILRAMGVNVVYVNDYDDTVCAALREVQPNYFGNGGDRTAANDKEHQVCMEYGITEVFGLGGEKIRSSSELVRKSHILHLPQRKSI